MNNKLAIMGGEPVRDTYLTYGRQWVDENDIDAVVNVLKGNYLTTGPNVGNFEKAVTEYVGAKYGVAVSNGTAALHVACLAAGIKEGDEVITTPITFAASANCVLYCGGTPVFADIDPKTYNISPEEIEKKITNKTKAIIPVDYTGQPADMDRIRKIAEKYNLIVIEDSAHSLGSEYKGKKVGTLAHMTEFSFHPVKPITTAEGGIVVTDDEELYKKLMLFRSHGITREESLLTHDEGPWYYEQLELGYNYRITDMQCALGISQMKKIDMFTSRRRQIVKIYNEAFKDIAQLITPHEAEYSNSGWHLYVIKLDLSSLKCDRRTIFEALQKENIGVNVHYVPVYLHPYYQRLGYKKGLCPEAEKLYESMITLPLFPKMEDKDVEDVINGVKKVLSYYGK